MYNLVALLFTYFGKRGDYYTSVCINRMGLSGEERSLAIGSERGGGADNFVEPAEEQVRATRDILARKL